MKYPIPDSALAQHIAVLGKTGSGKTNTGKTIVEHVFEEDARVCILDPIKSDWWGLISSADGRRPGLPFHILGGPRGHVPVHAAAGKAIAELVAAGTLPHSIIDMADFAPGGQAKFFIDFAPTLLRRMRGVVYLVLEEAHLFAPKERSGMGDENMMIHWAKMLATAGRSKGIRLVLVTQRTQSLHNALLGSCDTIIAQRLTAPADQKPVKEWLKANVDEATRKRVEESLASLKTGAGWLCSGEARVFDLVQFPRAKTFDNTATPTGDGDAIEVRTVAVDRDKLRTIVGDAVAEAQANDPAELKKRVRELEKQLAAKPDTSWITQEQFAEEVDSARRAAYEQGKLDGVNAGMQTGMCRAFTEIEALAERMTAALPRIDARPENPVRRVEPVARAARLPESAPTVARARQIDGRASSSSEPPLPKAWRAILGVLAQHREGRTKSQLGILSGYSSTSSTFDNALSALRTKEYINRGAPITATDAGLQALGSYDPLPVGKALQEYWLAKLGKAERTLLTCLLKHRGRGISRAQLSQQSQDEFPPGYSDTSSTFDNALSKLRTLELISGRGELRASEDLFA